MKKYELRKGLVIGIIILMMGVNTNLSNARDIAEEPTSLIVLDDELDQYQTFCDGVMELGYVEDYNFKYAQSFIPQKNILTRVFIYAERVGQPYPFHLAIRKGLEEENLTAVSVDYNNIPYDLTWVEFDFVDIPVTVGETYYMIMSTQTKHSTIYGVGLGSPNPYPDGGFWYSIDWQEWGELIGTDLCFKTYGQGGPPNIPEIDGPINGEIGITYDYNFTAIDPDEDDVWYYIEWGDGDVEEWIGPYSSGEEVVRSHTWDDKDTYTIRAKAKDIFDAESDWGTLQVTCGQDGPPNIPEIDGPINGEIGITYDYNFTAIDPDEGDVWYYIEWGDGDVEEWIGPYSSGGEVVRSHTWDDEDTYTIRAKAKDIFDAESDWGTLQVTMPVNQHNFYSFPILERLLERFPNMFPILRNLLLIE